MTAVVVRSGNFWWKISLPLLFFVFHQNGPRALINYATRLRSGRELGVKKGFLFSFRLRQSKQRVVWELQSTLVLKMTFPENRRSEDFKILNSVLLKVLWLGTPNELYRLLIFAHLV